MKIHTRLNLVSNRWVAQIGLYSENPFTVLEEHSLVSVGQPLVDIGGDFSFIIPNEDPEGEPTTVTFSIVSSLLRLPEDFPVKKIFDTEDSMYAKEQAQHWLTTIQSRMQQARDSILTVDFSGSEETVTTA